MKNAIKTDWRLIAFYVGVPVLLPLYTSLHNWEFQQVAGYTGTAAFYLAHSVLPWWITCLSTFAVMKALARWKPAPLLIMIPGTLLGCVLAFPYTVWVTDLFLAIWPLGANATEQLQVGSWSGNFFNYVARASLIWLIINFIFDRFVGLPRYRYEIPKGYDNTGKPAGTPLRPVSDSTMPAFISRLPVHINSSDILALKAEQHYVRIFTADREHMILYRFSDAVSQLDADLGMQVHRSWWVAHAAMSSLQNSGKKLYVILTSGEEVPVSTPYQGLLKELAKSRNIPLRPIPQKKVASS